MLYFLMRASLTVDSCNTVSGADHSYSNRKMQLSPAVSSEHEPPCARWYARQSKNAVPPMGLILSDK